MAKADFFKVHGLTGLNRYGGRLQEEFLRELQGAKWRKTVQEMLTDPVIEAVRFAIEMLIRQVKWEVVEADDSSAAMDTRDFIEGALHDMEVSWSNLVAEILSMLHWGFAYFELVYKRRDGDSRDPNHKSKFADGRIGWRTWGIRAQEVLDEWEFDAEDKLLGMWQIPPPSFRRRFIPLEKALLFRTSTRKNNPEGKSILRGAYRPWYFKRNIENIEGIGIERDLAGLPVGFVPPEILVAETPEAQAAFDAIKDVVTQIRRDEQEGILWPLAYDEDGNQLYDLKLLSTGGQRQFDTSVVIQRYDSRIAMTVMADFLLIGHEKVGSFALASSKTSLFSVAIGAILDIIAEEINRKAIPELLRLNGLSMELSPKLARGDIETVDLTALGAYITALTGSGVMFDESEQNWLKRQAGIPVSGH